jgi:rhodanese-related sulfurtransferase
MLKLLASSAVLTLVVASAQPARACDGPEGAHKPTTADASKAPKADVKKLSVEELAARMAAAEKKKAAVAIFDVNSQETRTAQGVIPTAVLLSSSKEYDLALLPKNKDAGVVFYCSNEQCGASTKAAKRALEAGHTDVSVLPAGIAGWVKAGKSVSKPSVS